MVGKLTNERHGMNTIFNLIEDPGHAWLEVPMELVSESGIASKVSKYSFQHNGRAYLEEDRDKWLFLDAWVALGKEFTINRMYREYTPIRGYKRFERVKA